MPYEYDETKHLAEIILKLNNLEDTILLLNLLQEANSGQQEPQTLNYQITAPSQWPVNPEVTCKT